MIQKTDHDILLEIHTMLLGTNGQGGLLRSHDALKKDYYKFKLVVILALLVLAGAAGYSIPEILKMIK